MEKLSGPWVKICLPVMQVLVMTWDSISNTVLQILENGNILTFDNGNLSFQSRALEIQVNEVGGDYSADIVWEHNLPSELYGSFSGNVQKLDNGNYLITTIGESGTSLEISPDHETIWEDKISSF